MKSSWFRSSRFKKGKLKGGNAGLGFQDRPGLGLSSPSVAKPSSANYEENEYLMSTATEKVSRHTPTVKIINIIFASCIYHVFNMFKD